MSVKSDHPGDRSRETRLDGPSGTQRQQLLLALPKRRGHIFAGLQPTCNDDSDVLPALRAQLAWDETVDCIDTRCHKCSTQFQWRGSALFKGGGPTVNGVAAVTVAQPGGRIGLC